MRWKKYLVVFGSVIVCLGVIYLLAGAICLIVANRAVDRELVAIKQDGLPVSWKEVENSLSSIDPDRRAQKELFAALEELKNAPRPTEEENKILPIEGWFIIPAGNDPIPAEVISALEKRVATLAPVVNHVRSAISKNPCWYVPPTNVLSVMPMGQIGSARQAARILAMETLLNASTNNPAAAVLAIEDGISLAKSLETAPTLIGGLVRLAVYGIAVNSAETVLCRTEPSGSDLERMNRIFSAPPADLHFSILTEVVYAKNMYASLEKEPGNADRDLMASLLGLESWQLRIMYSFPLISRAWWKMNEKHQLEYLHELTVTWRLPWPEFEPVTRKAAEKIPRLYFMARMCDLFASARKKDLSMQGKRNCVAAGIAVKKYAQKNGRLPDKLEALVPDYMAILPASPFSPEPLDYSTSNNMAIISFKVPEKKEPEEFRVVHSR